VVLDADGNMTAVLKPEEEWSTYEDELALGNSKKLNALFNGGRQEYVQIDQAMHCSQVQSLK